MSRIWGNVWEVEIGLEFGVGRMEGSEKHKAKLELRVKQTDLGLWEIVICWMAGIGVG